MKCSCPSVSQSSNKSTAFCTNGEKYETQYMLHTKMMQHYQRIGKAKSQIDNSPPHSVQKHINGTYKKRERRRQNKAHNNSINIPPLASQVHRDFSPCQRPHSVSESKNIRVVLNPNLEPNEEYIFVKEHDSPVKTHLKEHDSPMKTRLTSTPSLETHLRGTSLQQENATDELEEHTNKVKKEIYKEVLEEEKYLAFTREITDEILRKEVFSNSAMKQIINTHVERSKDLLDMRLMMRSVESLSRQLGLDNESQQHTHPSSSWGDQKSDEDHVTRQNARSETQLQFPSVEGQVHDYDQDFIDQHADDMHSNAPSENSESDVEQLNKNLESDETVFSGILSNDAALSAIVSNETALSAITSNETVLLSAVTSNETALNAITSNETALLSAVTSNETALSAITSNETAILSAVTRNETALSAITSNETALLSAVTSNETALLSAITSNETALLSAVTSNETALSAITSNETALLSTATSNETMLTTASKETLLTATTSGTFETSEASEGSAGSTPVSNVSESSDVDED